MYTAAMTIPRRTALILTFSILVILTTIYIASPIKTQYDSRWSIHTAMSLIDGRGGDLSDYMPVLKSNDFYCIEYPGGRPHTFFPIGVSVLVAPIVAVIAAVDPSFKEMLRHGVPGNLEKVLASIFGAAAAAIFFWIAFGQFQNLTIAWVMTAVFAFATSMWSTATRGLWQHGPLVLMFVIGMLLLQRAKLRPALVQYVSLPLAMAYVVRPTAAIAVVVLTIYVAVFYRRWLLRYIGWALLIAVPWLAFNLATYGALFSPYYLGLSYAGKLVFHEAFFGQLISPSRGLLVYSPVFLLAFTGFALSLRKAEDRALHLSYGAIVAGILLSQGLVPNWWAGHSFGPRYATDIVPFFAYFTAFNLQLPASFGRRARAVAWSGTLALATVSTVIHAQGALRVPPNLWNVIPNNVDQHPERLWDWTDLQFMRTRASYPRP
jgi:hypothetical protein